VVSELERAALQYGPEKLITLLLPLSQQLVVRYVAARVTQKGNGHQRGVCMCTVSARGQANVPTSPQSNQRRRTCVGSAPAISESSGLTGFPDIAGSSIVCPVGAHGRSRCRPRRLGVSGDSCGPGSILSVGGKDGITGIPGTQGRMPCGRTGQ
jgi:hypothetical protein